MDVLNRRKNWGLRGGLRGLVWTALISASAPASELGGGHLVVRRDEAAADCPDEAALAAATLALGTPSPTAAEPLEIEVSFRRAASGYVAEVRASGRTEGVRELAKEGATCAPLAEAVSVVLAVLLDLTPREPPAAPAAPPPPAPPPPPPAERPTAPQSPAPSVEPTEPTEPLSVGLRIEGGAAYRLVGDGFAGTVSLAAGPRLDRWEASLGALWAPRGNADYLGHSIEMSLVSGRLGGCAWLQRTRTRADVGVCAGFSVGNLHAQGRGFPTEETANDAWLAFDAGVAGRLPLTRKWALRLTISAVVPTRAQTYTASGSSEVLDHSAAAALFQLGPELTFP